MVLDIGWHYRPKDKRQAETDYNYRGEYDPKPASLSLFGRTKLLSLANLRTLRDELDVLIAQVEAEG